MTTTTGADNAAVRDDPPVANDFGLVVRVINDPSNAPVALLNGTETFVPADGAVSILAANPIPPSTPGARVTTIIQNVGGANVRVGVAGVTSTTGLRLVPGAVEIIDACPDEMWAIGEAADSSVFAQETVLA